MKEDDKKQQIHYDFRKKVNSLGYKINLSGRIDRFSIDFFSANWARRLSQNINTLLRNKFFFVSWLVR